MCYVMQYNVRGLGQGQHKYGHLIGKNMYLAPHNVALCKSPVVTFQQVVLPRRNLHTRIPPFLPPCCARREVGGGYALDRPACLVPPGVDQRVT
jgi:hypothetical protein